MLYLSDADVRALGITPVSIIDLVGQAFRARRAGEIVNPEKQHLALADQPVFFQTLSCVRADGYACVKWIGVSARARAASVNTVLCLSDATTAQPLAVMDANWITGMRTAAVSLIGARWIGGRTGGVVGILGTGIQAHAHLEMFAAGLDVERFVLWGRRDERTAGLCSAARGLGCRAEVASSPETLLRTCDVVISALGAHTTAASVGFDAGALKPGAYLSLVDLGRPWVRSSLSRVAMYADDDELTTALMQRGSLPIDCRFVDDLVTLSVSQAGNSGGNAAAPLGLLHPGVGYADLALAGHIFEKARDVGCGTILPG